MMHTNTMRKIVSFVVLLLMFLINANGQVWQPDQGDGTYKNPIIFADYSDPDVVGVGKDFYMVASSFTCMPGIPVLHSQDLVNWEIIGHVYDRLPLEKYNKPQHGEGSWAPSIRYHGGRFYVYFCTPKDGLFMASSEDPAGKWQLHHVVKASQWEDPCPVWDDDGSAYLVHSKLRGCKLFLHKLSPDGKKILDNGTLIFEDEKNQPTIEGPKFLKKDDTYYIIAPAGGVPTGWQTVLRSKNIYGPYEQKVVLERGSTEINGPHQGGLVELESGEWWFVHFQDRGAYGRIVHLQPVIWKEGWPLMGVDQDDNGIGEPVMKYAKPNVGKAYPVKVPQTTDAFEGENLGLQWQWQANPGEAWYELIAGKGVLRLHAVNNPTEDGNLWYSPNILLQKFPAREFTATTKMRFSPGETGEKAGLTIMGRSYAYLALIKKSTEVRLVYCEGSNAGGGGNAQEIEGTPWRGDDVYLQVKISNGAVCHFSYSVDNETFTPIGRDFEATAGVWIGAKVGIFHVNPNLNPLAFGHSEFEWFKVE
jgi:beta-xylosidase